MAVHSNYFAVTMHTSPFEFGQEKEIGWYTNKQTALNIAELVRNAFHGRINGGIDLDVKTYQDVIIKTSLGLRLKDTPRGAIITLTETTTPQHVKLIFDSVLKNIKPHLLIDTSTKGSTGIDEPKSILRSVFHCVVLDFQPFDGSHRLTEYYQTKSTAEHVAKFITQTFSIKVGCGFNTEINSYQGTIVEHKSGRQYLKIDDKFREIKSSCDNDESIRIIDTVNEAIKKWG